MVASPVRERDKDAAITNMSTHLLQSLHGREAALVVLPLPIFPRLVRTDHLRSATMPRSSIARSLIRSPSIDLTG